MAAPPVPQCDTVWQQPTGTSAQAAARTRAWEGILSDQPKGTDEKIDIDAPQMEMDPPVSSKPNQVVPAPRKTHALIVEGHRTTWKLMLLGIVVLFIMLAANFGLNVLAVVWQKETKVSEDKGWAPPVLRDHKTGNQVVVQALKHNGSLIELPEAEPTYLIGMERLLVHTDQSSVHGFSVSAWKFRPMPGNDTLFKFSIDTKSGHLMTWNRPLQRSAGSNYLFANDDDDGLPDITITHQTEETETVTDSPAGLAWGAHSGSGGWVFSSMGGQQDFWRSSSDDGGSGRQLEEEMHDEDESSGLMGWISAWIRRLTHHRRRRRGCQAQSACAYADTRAPPQRP